MEVVRQLPPGFRFHPTDEELVVQYLRRKALARPLPAAVIPVVHDAGELDPWDLPGASEGEAYFFSLRRRAAPARGGGYRRRRTASGYWKATGKEKPVFLQCCGSGSKRLLLVGVKTALAFHRAKPPSPSPSSSRTGWVMHEYRLAAPGAAPPPAEQKKSAHHSFVAQAEEWVVCRIFLKNKPTSRRHHGEVDGQTPGSSGAAHDDVHRSPLSGLPPPSSSSSCVTGISDEDEVSSGSSISPATVASQRETGEC